MASLVIRRWNATCYGSVTARDVLGGKIPAEGSHGVYARSPQICILCYTPPGPRSPRRSYRPLRWRPAPTRGSVPLTVPGVLAALELDMAQKKASITTLALCGFSACERMSRIPCMALSRIASVPRIPCPLLAPLAQPQRSILLK
jgi:hypothetical protein